MATGRQPNLGEVLAPERRVTEGTISLSRSGRGVTGAIPKEPCRHAGVDVDDPGTRNWYYWRNEGLLIIDLGGEFEDDGE